MLTLNYPRKYKIKVFKGTIRELRIALIVSKTLDIPLFCLSK